jgi:hypothetical protein
LLSPPETLLFFRIFLSTVSYGTLQKDIAKLLTTLELIIGGAALQVRQCLSEQLTWFLYPSFNRTSLGLLLASDSTRAHFPSLLFLFGVMRAHSLEVVMLRKSSTLDKAIQRGARWILQKQMLCTTTIR